MRKIKLLISGLLFVSLIQAQETFPVNGVADKRSGTFAFTNATIVKDAQTTLQNATLVISDGKIVAVGMYARWHGDKCKVKDKFVCLDPIKQQ